MSIAGTQTTAANGGAIKSGMIPGLGCQAVVTVVHSGTYTNPGGDAVDLSAVFPTEVLGGRPISDTVDDGGYKSTYVRAAAGAPDTGVIQMYWVDANNAGDAAFVQVADMTALTAIDGQLWIFNGR